MPGLCAGCELLRPLSGAVFERTKRYPKCVNCGMIYSGMTDMQDGYPLCAACAHLTDPLPASSLAAQQQVERSAKMSFLALQKVKRTPGTASTPISMAVSIIPAKPFIAVDIFLSGQGGKPKPQSTIGTLAFEFDIDDPLDEVVLECFLKAAAPTWEARHENSLQSMDVQIRFHNNVTLLCDPSVLLREFIHSHKDYIFAKQFLNTVKPTAKSYGVFPAFIYFELHVQADLYCARTLEGIKLAGLGKRRFEEDDRASKCPQTTPGPILSLFKPRAAYADPSPKTNVTLMTMSISIDDDTGDVNLDESTRKDTGTPSYIHDEKLAKGTMKVVHLTSTEKNSTVSISDNDELLTNELILLSEVKHFLKQFLLRGREWTADLDESLAVSEAWLAFEKVDIDGEPCLAAGIAEMDYHNAWQLPQGRLGATINAFIHFAYVYSQNSMVLCDVQTMKARIGGELKNVIFDLMTHTPKGTSGPGDHGKAGIEDFLEGHECNSKCEA
ncbi:kinase-like domain-containing protein [Mycena pura]|uniref:Kinase-like domain-containing protein n=1 Tax=Mycena pura TaxID=153505 RepID=A0AAD6YDG2_9AGAR|nr:kinase-like domain-containing protein [Mycena pura]